MNNLLSYCGLVDPRISASDKDLPVETKLGHGLIFWCSKFARKIDLVKTIIIQISCSWRFLRYDKLEQLEFKLEKNYWDFRNMHEKLEKDICLFSQLHLYNNDIGFT